MVPERSDSLHRVRTLLLAVWLVGSAARADQPLATAVHSAALASLFPPEEAVSLSKTLPLTQQVRFRVWLSDSTNPGVLVFVKPIDSGEPPPGWLAILQQKHLNWIAAEDFGNQKLSAQRVLASVMALKLMRQLAAIDPNRTYIGGMSGGGRIASQVSTRFPQMFSGALYVVGADYWMPRDAQHLRLVAAHHYVFVTGARDFNLREMKQVYEKYQANGITQVLLMNLPQLGHEYPPPAELGKAIDFLDGPSE